MLHQPATKSTVPRKSPCACPLGITINCERLSPNAKNKTDFAIEASLIEGDGKYAKTECVFAPSVIKMQEILNKMPAVLEQRGGN